MHVMLYMVSNSSKKLTLNGTNRISVDFSIVLIYPDHHLDKSLTLSSEVTLIQCVHVVIFFPSKFWVLQNAVPIELHSDYSGKACIFLHLHKGSSSSGFVPPNRCLASCLGIDKVQF